MAPSTPLRRLLRETLELSASSSNPNPSFHAHPVSDEDLFEWHFTLLGPPSPSPYAGGLYHGRISLPLTYPLKPPNFRFLTPSGRFEVNREICLSISGFHEESWMPAWGIRTALVALRTFMGEEGTAGQVGGMEASKEVRQKMAKESRQWRCDGCGGRTNEENMREWWETCREKGVKVEEEAGLEELPEGLRLGFKDQLGNGQKTEAGRASSTARLLDEGKAVADKDVSITGTDTTPVPVEGTSSTFDSIRPQSFSEHLPGTSRQVTPETSGSSPHSTSREQAIDPSRPAATSSVTPRAPTAPSMTVIETPREPQATTPILDKAISGLVLAILFMVLKKVLYNPNVIAYDY